LPRFYFHMTSGASSIFASEGIELDDLSAAHRLALRIICETMEYLGPELACRSWQVQIADASGSEMLTVLYPSRGPRQRTPPRDDGRAAKRRGLFSL
jgi:hypothetical protein